MEYETLVSEYVDYGRNKFLEVSKKRVSSDGTIFMNISKGFYTPEGERRYQRGIGFPNEKEVIDSLLEKLKIVADKGEEDAGEELMEESPMEDTEDELSLEDAI